MKNLGIRLSVVVISTLLVLTSLTAFECAAVIVFLEDFQDGNIDDWTVYNGNFTVCEYAPGQYALLTGTGSYITISASCRTPAVSEGTWSLDYYHRSYTDSTSQILFFMNGTNLIDDLCGYYLDIDRTGDALPSLRLCKQNKSTTALITFWIFPDHFGHTWTNFTMTRIAATGEMNVFVNGTHVIQAFDTTWNHSEVFAHWNFKVSSVGQRYIQGLMFDNITITDDLYSNETITTSTTSTTSTTTESTSTTPEPTGPGFTLDPMLLAVGGGIIVVLVVIVVIIKRK